MKVVTSKMLVGHWPVAVSDNSTARICSSPPPPPSSLLHCNPFCFLKRPFLPPLGSPTPSLSSFNLHLWRSQRYSAKYSVSQKYIRTQPLHVSALRIHLFGTDCTFPHAHALIYNEFSRDVT